MSDDRARDRPRDGTRADVQIAGAYRSRRHTDHRIPRIHDPWLGSILHLESTLLHEYDGSHAGSIVIALYQRSCDAEPEPVPPLEPGWGGSD